eukprot:1182118-Prorocentrum_minimum.AAC.3
MVRQAPKPPWACPASMAGPEGNVERPVFLSLHAGSPKALRAHHDGSMTRVDAMQEHLGRARYQYHTQ